MLTFLTVDECYTDCNCNHPMYCITLAFITVFGYLSYMNIELHFSLFYVFIRRRVGECRVETSIAECSFFSVKVYRKCIERGNMPEHHIITVIVQISTRGRIFERSLPDFSQQRRIFYN